MAFNYYQNTQGKYVVMTKTLNGRPFCCGNFDTETQARNYILLRLEGYNA